MGRGGPGGGLIGIVGQGIGIATEYHAHRKQQKHARKAARQSADSEEDAAGPSSRPSPRPPLRERDVSSSSLPPAYTERAADRSDRPLASGAPASSDKKAAMAQYDDDRYSDYSDRDEVETLEDDEELWQLDEVLDHSTSNSPDAPSSYEESEDARNNEELVQDVLLTTHQPGPPPPEFLRPLPCPVIIPQRRPRKKVRGFVRAYAPLLGECAGIDQETFLKFLKNFHKSSQASPIFPIIQVSAAIAGFAPSVIAMAVSTVVQVGAQVGAEVQMRHRTNNFLDRMNEEFFKPRGLFAMIMKHKSDADISQSNIGARFGFRPEVVNMNTNQVIAKYNRPVTDQGGHGLSSKMKNVRIASGTTRGAVELPEAAPLVFPDIDMAIAANGENETFKGKAKDAKKFLANYLDKRAQLKYAQDDPSSGLVVPADQVTFKSKLADPTHPMYQGGLVGFVTGGKINPQAINGGLRDARYDAMAGRGGRGRSRRYDYYDDFDDGYGGRRSARRAGGGGGLVGTLVGAAVEAASNRANPPAPYGGQRYRQESPGSLSGSREYEDAYYDRYDAPLAPRQQAYRRSFDDRGARPYPARPSYGRRQRGGGGGIGMVKKLMSEDVMYLMIVNMPSEEELAEARAMLET